MPSHRKRQHSPPPSGRAATEGEEGGAESTSRRTSRTIADSASPTESNVALIPQGWKFAVVVQNRPVPSPPASNAATLTASSVPSGASCLTARGHAPAVASPAVASPAVASPAVASPAVASPAVASPAVASPAAASPAESSSRTWARGGVLAAAISASSTASHSPAHGKAEVSPPPASVETTAPVGAGSAAPDSTEPPKVKPPRSEASDPGVQDPTPNAAEPVDPAVSVLPVAASSPRGPQAAVKARDSETPSADVASRSNSAAPGRPFKGYKISVEELTRLKQEKPEMFRLLFWRNKIQKCDKKIKEQGADSLAMNDINELKQGMASLAYLKFEDDAMEWIDKSSILVALRLLMNRKNFDDDTVEMATHLRQRWEDGNFNPGPLLSEQQDVSDSEPDPEPAQNRRLVDVGGFAQTLLNGILRFRNAKGNLTMTLDPKGLKRRADIFGHNGLTVGDWWPYQLCALRDGAHGSRQGGIAGRTDTGAFSIVVAAESEYNNEDSGETLSYLGTQHIGPEGVTILTNATKSLVMSIHTRKPVRVIRRGPSPGSRIYPSCGFRYDGLYTVTGRSLVRAKRNSPDEHDFYKFTLVRNPDQPPLSEARLRPTMDEYSAYNRLVSN